MKKLFILIPLLGLTAFAHAGHGPQSLVSATSQLEHATHNMYVRAENGPRYYGSVDEARALSRAAAKLNRDARHRAPGKVLRRDLERVERRFYALKRTMSYADHGRSHYETRIAWSNYHGVQIKRSRPRRGLQRSLRSIANSIDGVERALKRQVRRGNYRGYSQRQQRSQDGYRGRGHDRD